MLAALLPEIVAYTLSTCSVLAVCRLPLRKAAFEHFLRWQVRQLSRRANQLYNRSLRSQAEAFGYERAMRGAMRVLNEDPGRARALLAEALDLWGGAPASESDGDNAPVA